MSAPAFTERRAIAMVRRMATGSGVGVRLGIGDDCAILEPAAGLPLLATTDLLAEDVHFRRRWATPADLGWKALAVNLSDIASMGGRPRWALVALALPDESTLEEVEAFYGGLLELATEHAVAVVGGDTSASRAGWVVNVTLLGEGLPSPLRRSTAQPGDVVAVSGPLGRSAAGLAVLEDARPARASAAAEVVSGHLRPRPRVREGRWLGETGEVSAMIDLSDGLATDLGHITEESGVGARVELARIPVDAATRAVGDALGQDPVAWATGGGEDYELLLTCPPGAFSRLREGLTRATGAVLTAVGEITREPGLRFVDVDGHPVTVERGFEHFVGRRPRD